MTTQISISKIENGWMIATPSTSSMIESSQRAGQQSASKVTYAQDYNQVCVVLAGLMGSENRISKA